MKRNWFKETNEIMQILQMRLQILQMRPNADITGETGVKNCILHVFQGFFSWEVKFSFFFVFFFFFFFFLYHEDTEMGIQVLVYTPEE